MTKATTIEPWPAAAAGAFLLALAAAFAPGAGAGPSAASAVDVVGSGGTPSPWLLGKNVSHGCVRLSNDDVRWLRARMPVGTPIKIVR